MCRYTSESVLPIIPAVGKNDADPVPRPAPHLDTDLVNPFRPTLKRGEDPSSSRIPHALTQIRRAVDAIELELGVLSSAELHQELSSNLPGQPSMESLNWKKLHPLLPSLPQCEVLLEYLIQEVGEYLLAGHMVY